MGGGGILWFQIHMFLERLMRDAMVQRAKDVGFEALVLTIDGPVAVNREHNKRSGFVTHFSVNTSNMLRAFHPRWIANVILPYLLHGGMSRHDNYPYELRRKITAEPVPRQRIREKIDSLTWEHMREVRKLWKGPLIAKGVLCAREVKLSAIVPAEARAYTRQIKTFLLGCPKFAQKIRRADSRKGITRSCRIRQKKQCHGCAQLHLGQLQNVLVKVPMGIEKSCLCISVPRLRRQLRALRHL